MCTEFFLALLYFLILFLVNYFLIKLLKENVKNFFYFLKIKKMFQLLKKKEQKRNLFSFLVHFSFFFKKKNNLFFLIEYLNVPFKFKDCLLIGSTYSFLYKNINFLRFDKVKTENFKKIELNPNKENEKLYFLSNQLYFQLLEKQYFLIY
jgi:hypothetical protein